MSLWKINVITILFLGVVNCVYAQDQTDCNVHHLAIQGVIVTNGNIGAGVAYYSDKAEVGFTVSGTINNRSQETKLITPALFGGLRMALSDKTYFAYGLDLATKIGKDSGKTIQSDWFVGPYVSLEQMLTQHVLLSGWVNPYSFEYEKTSGSSTSTHNIFGSGGLAISYLF